MGDAGDQDGARELGRSVDGTSVDGAREIVHRIRLAGPWDFVSRQGERTRCRWPITWSESVALIGKSDVNSVTDAENDRCVVAEPHALHGPGEPTLHDAAGGRFERVFHRPTGLEPSDRLWLRSDPWPCEVHVSLNGRVLSSWGPSADSSLGRPWRWELSDVQPTNRLVLQVDVADEVNRHESSLNAQPAPLAWVGRIELEIVRNSATPPLFTAAD